jgi:NAD-dependent SIR2 family protein deacetylase
MTAKGGSSALAAMLKARSETGAPPVVVQNSINSTTKGRGGSSALAAMLKARAEMGAPPEVVQLVMSSPVKGNEGSSNIAAMLKARAEMGAPPEVVKKSISSVPSSPAPPAQQASTPPPPMAAPTTPPPSVPTNTTTYTPKTATFSGAPKCHVCEKTVYKMEEVIALGCAWHSKCFRCGGKQPVGENPGCGRVLTRDGYLDHHNEPFCNACYNKLYRPKGFGFGNTLNTDYGPVISSDVAVSPPVAPASTPPVAPVSTPPPVPSPILSSPTDKASRSTAQPAKYTPTNNTTTNSSTAPKCTICSKTVYKMEEMVAVGRVWHSSCFTCGGSKGDGCGRVLKRDDYLDHENQPYCNACYGKLFRPKGFGFGNTLNTNYGQSPVVTEQPTEKPSVISTLSTTQEAAPKKPVGIGASTRAPKDAALHKEAEYVGDNDEVDESEW